MHQPDIVTHSTRNVRLVCSAALISSFGDWMYRLALPLLVLHITGSPVAVAITYALEYGPFVLLSPIGGIAADRYDRRRLLIGGDVLATVVSVAITVTSAGNTNIVALIYLSAALLASVGPFYHPALHSLLPSLVERDRYAAVTAALQGTDNVSTLVGPLAAGVVVSQFGVPAAMAINAVSFAVSGACVCALRGQRRTARQRADASQGHPHGVRAALRFIKADAVLLPATVLFVGVNLGSALVQANIVYYLVKQQGQIASHIGVVFAAEGIGALAGTAIVPRLLNRYQPGPVIVAAVLVSAAATTSLLAPIGLVEIAAAWSIQGAATAAIVTMWFALRVQRTPPEMLGRVVGLTRMIAFATIPIGSVVGGVLVEQLHGIRWVIAISALVQVASAAAATSSRLVRTPAGRSRSTGADRRKEPTR